jgi:hypothetical protein
MSPDNNDQTTATYREEPDRVILLNPAFSLAVSTANGNLLSLHYAQTQTEFIDPGDAAANGFLWRLAIAADSGDTISVTNRDCAEFTHSTGYHRHDGNLRLWLQWRGLRAGAEKLDARVTAQITVPAHTPTALFDAEIELPDHLAVRSFAFPGLCALRSPDALADDALFLPLSGGVLLPDPCSALGSDPGRGWQAAYPGPASMQFLGYSCGGRDTAWLAAGDPEGAVKTLSAATMPRSSRLALTIAHHPARRPDGLWSCAYPCLVGLVFGDWFEAAREYRAWAAGQPWCARGRGGERRLPALTSSYGLWASHWGGPRRAAAAARDLQRLANVPIKLDWRCWHGCARDGAYPDYFPPRDGGPAFALAKEQLGQAGALTQLGLNALAASPDSEAWESDRAERYALRPPQGDPTPSLGVSLHAHLRPMCPSTRYWREKLAALARQAVSSGADGIYLEGLAARPPLLCLDSDHGHGAPLPTQWAAGIRAAIGAVRTAIGANLHLTLDGPAETCLDLANAFFSDHPAAERHGLLPDSSPSRWSPIPLFSSVYHDYATLVGPGISLVNRSPHDPLWSADVVADLRSPAPLMAGDYQAQFCLELGRAAVWGHHPLLANFSPEQARSDVSLRKLAFLAAVLRAQSWGVGALLPYSEFMGPLSIDSSPAEIEFLVNPSGSTPADRRAIRRSVHPVLGSAWRTPGSGLALLLANTGQQSREFTARLRSSRLSLQLPLRLVGRTFCEDGDMPAASLRPSGSEVSGRLPGRCVVLISLH